MTGDSPEAVLDYWFEPGQEQRWFRDSATTDAEIRERFADVWRRACENQLDHWSASARGRLALVILLDQFSRNLNRNSPLAFAHDVRAQQLSIAAEAAGHVAELSPIERAFLYMPLMHAEERRLQERCVELFEALGRESGDCAQFPKYARLHRDVVARFGRFPHRNAVLGRQSTAAESEFLAQGGMFGGGAS